MVEALPQDPWQQIESAPLNEPVIVSGFIHDDESGASGRWRCIARTRGTGWYECTAEGDQDFRSLYPPTHWMPLPEPPK